MLLAYEKTGYDATVKGRLPDLLNEWSVRRLVDAGANAIKILLYYDPADDEEVNTVKHAFIERIGSECMALDVPFFLEPVTYRDDITGLEWAKAKPEAVTRSMEEFSKAKYGVDVLKVEVPIDMKFVSGTQSFTGEEAYTRADALRLFKEASDVATKPFIYLSAGVSNEQFVETLAAGRRIGRQFLRCPLWPRDLARWRANLRAGRARCAESVALDPGSVKHSGGQRCRGCRRRNPGGLSTEAKTRSKCSIPCSTKQQEGTAPSMPGIGIHGFGRIGRSAMRIALANDLFSPVSISDIRDLDTFAALFKVDTNYGVFPEPVSTDGNTLKVGSRSIKYIDSRKKSRTGRRWGSIW